jgi:hypothetical protein
VDHTGSAAAHYAALRSESTIRRWLLAVTLGAATGLFTNLVLPWPLPLLAAAITVAMLMIWDRRHGTIADLWPGDHPPHRLAATATRLERHGWTALSQPAHPHHDTPLAAYLLIGPGGVFVIDHQVWWAADSVTTDPATRQLMVGGKPAARRVASVKAAAAAVTHALTSRLPDEAVVRPVLSVDGPMLEHMRLVAGCGHAAHRELTGFLHSHDLVLSPDQVAALTEHAHRLYTPR